MSVISHSPICDPSIRTDLGKAFDDHIQAYGRNPAMRLADAEPDWLNVMRARAQRTSDSHLRALTDQMLDLLLNSAQASGSFQKDFLALYENAGRHAYPLAWSLRGEQRALAGMTRDYTLLCFDAGMIRRMEDDAVDDEQMRTFVQSMLEKLRSGKNLPGNKVFPAVFEIYSEAIVYRLLRERGGSNLRISKIPEGDDESPDFECVLKVRSADLQERELTFYVEVKTLDIVHAPQRLEQMLEEGL